MSLVRFRARNHPQQPTRDDVDDRRTPVAFFAGLHARHRFTVDAAASAVNALLPKYWTREQDALSRAWRGERVWCNPPYSKIEPWVAKAWDEMERGGCESVAMLLPANRCEQAWWQMYVESQRDGRYEDGAILLTTTFLAGRMRFGWPADHVTPIKGDRPPFGLVLLEWVRE